MTLTSKKSEVRSYYSFLVFFSYLKNIYKSCVFVWVASFSTAGLSSCLYSAAVKKSDIVRFQSELFDLGKYCMLLDRFVAIINMSFYIVAC